MSRRGGPRGSNDDLAYGELPQRWDRDRFERFGGGPPRRSEEDYSFQERDRPGRRDVAVQERIDTSGPRGRFEESDRFYEEDRWSPRSPQTAGGRRRRTDKELFGDVDPREFTNMALTPYRGKSQTRRELDIDRRTYEEAPPPSRPGLLRRQSSLDTFDRRPITRYEREERRIPVYTAAPIPYRRREEDFYEDYRGREYEPEDYREVEITRERSVHRSRPPPPPKSVKSAKSVKSSKAKSVTTKQSSSSSSTESFEEVDKKSVHESAHGGGTSFHESFHESVHDGGGSVHESFHESVHDGTATSISESIQQTEKKFKKGKTRMPKRLVRREAIMDLGYPFDEEEDFFVLRIALEKEQIDEVMRITETYKNGEKKTVYKYEEKLDEAEDMAQPEGEREEVVRREWINPPSEVGRRRSRSRGGKASRSRHASRRRESNRDDFFEERDTVIEERSPPQPPQAPSFHEERKTVVEETTETLSPTQSHHSNYRSPSHGALVVQDREYRSDRDIRHEIHKLESERRALRLERDADEKRNRAVAIRERPDEDYQLVEYDRVRPAREVLEIYDRDRSPERNVVRVEKDRKGRMALVRSTH